MSIFKHQPEPRKLYNPQTATVKVLRERLDYLRRDRNKIRRCGDDPYFYSLYIKELQTELEKRSLPKKMPQPAKYKNTESKSDKTLRDKLSYLGERKKAALERGDDPYYIEEYMNEIRTILDKRHRKHEKSSTFSICTKKSSRRNMNTKYAASIRGIAINQ